jgi:phage terminase large subunit-like protein
VVAGEIDVCRYVRVACQRHLDDLEADTDFAFSESNANRVAQFIEMLPHVKGKWAKSGELIRLEDWQCFVICVVFGWVHRADTSRRRFTKAYIEVPRKNAKSTKAAGIGDYMLAADGEFGAEVYSGATSEKQAWEVFRPAKLMLERSPDIASHFGVQVNAKSLSVESTGSRFEPVIGNPGDGASPHCAIIDEYHEHNTDDQFDTMETGMGARESPLLFVITTAGSDTSGPCYALRSQVVNMLDGTQPNPHLFGIIYTIDEGDKWTDPGVLTKANPNIDVSVRRDYLEAQQREAINNPRKQATFQTKHLNVWVTAREPFFNLEQWNRLGDTGLNPADLSPLRS